MMQTVKLRNTRCAICRTEGNASELYPANFDLQALKPAVFSARRLPDRVHYRLVKCNTCGLGRSDPIAQYTDALRLEPELAAALNNLAWIRAAHSEAKLRDGAEAVRLAERACRVTGYQQPQFVGILAAAYAEAGRFDEATGMAEKARTLALAAGQNELAQKDQQLLELFGAHLPHHESRAIRGAK
jgi:tetratricopeptide (TPR) repeat protein